VYEIQDGQRIQIYKSDIDSLKHYQLLSSHFQSFQELKEYLKEPDVFIFDFDSKNMIIYGRDTNKGEQCY
jgi:hypothetical protein